MKIVTKYHPPTAKRDGYIKASGGGISITTTNVNPYGSAAHFNIAHVAMAKRLAKTLRWDVDSLTRGAGSPFVGYAFTATKHKRKK